MEYISVEDYISATESAEQDEDLMRDYINDNYRIESGYIENRE